MPGVDLSTISLYNAENHNFEVSTAVICTSLVTHIRDCVTTPWQVLSVKPLEGTLEPQSSTFLHFTFRPLEVSAVFGSVQFTNPPIPLDVSRS